jgi:hypothetical protein
MSMFIGLFFLVWLHFVLYSLDKSNKGYQDESFIDSTYAAALLAAGGEIGLALFKKMLVRIACFLSLVPYILVVALLGSIALSTDRSSVPYTGSDFPSNYHFYLETFPYAISIALFLGFIHIVGAASIPTKKAT